LIANAILLGVLIVGGGLMRWFKTRYVQSLEEELSRLRTEIQHLRQHSDRLTERLLRKGGIPSVELPPEPTKEALDKMLQSHNIFDDIDEPKESDLVDNRREKYDEFVS
jgi:hypothetical protein